MSETVVKAVLTGIDSSGEKKINGTINKIKSDASNTDVGALGKAYAKVFDCAAAVSFKKIKTETTDLSESIFND